MTETWPSVPSATPRALIQLVPFHLNFDYETAPAEVPHKKGIIRFAPPRLQQIRPTYFSSWEENWSFPDSVSTHPEKEKPRSGKKRTTLTSNGSPTYLSSLLKGGSWRELRKGRKGGQRNMRNLAFPPHMKGFSHVQGIHKSKALIQSVPFHMNFDYETAPAEVPHKKGILRFAPPRLQQIRPTYFSSWEENWSFPDSVCTHPEKEKPRSGKKRTTLTSNGSPTYLSSLLKGSSWRELRGGRRGDQRNMRNLTRR